MLFYTNGQNFIEYLNWSKIEELNHIVKNGEKRNEKVKSAALWMNYSPPELPPLPCLYSESFFTEIVFVPEC